jgi:DnaD/phage-associated family protein
MTSTFKGFPQGKVRLTPVPELFFRELLTQIDDLGELKVSLYAFWRLNLKEGSIRYLLHSDFAGDGLFMQGLGETPQEAEAALGEALERAAARGTLLKASVAVQGGEQNLYFLNSPRGQAALQAIARGEWRPSALPEQPVEILEEAPNIFRLYEEHIGPLTPLIADALQDAEKDYPALWIEDAFRIAVENNARSWRYIQAILERWQEKGRDEQEDRRDTEKARRKYAEWEDLGSG